MLFVGSTVAGAAIAVGNVLAPSIVKREFPSHAGRLLGVYAMTLSGGAALEAGVTAPISLVDGFGWRLSLAPWSIPALLAAVLWLSLRQPRGSLAGVETRLAKPVWTSPLAWCISGYMGLQSLSYYSTTA